MKINFKFTREIALPSNGEGVGFLGLTKCKTRQNKKSSFFLFYICRKATGLIFAWITNPSRIINWERKKNSSKCNPINWARILKIENWKSEKCQCMITSVWFLKNQKKYDQEAKGFNSFPQRIQPKEKRVKKNPKFKISISFHILHFLHNPIKN